MLLRNIISTENVLEGYKVFLESEEKADKTVTSYSSNINLFLVYLKETLGITDLDLVTISLIRKYILFCKNDLANSNNTIYLKKASLKNFFEYLYSSNLIKSNPTETLSMKSTRTSTLTTSILDIKTYQKLKLIIYEEKHPMHILLFELLTRFRLKPHSICSIKLNQIVINNNVCTLLIDDSSSRTESYLDEYLTSLLKDWLLIRNFKSCIHEDLFITERNSPLTYHSLRYIIISYHRILGIDHMYSLKSYYNFNINDNNCN